MKRFAAALAFGAAMATGAAFADTIQNGYGNTFVVTAEGNTVRYQFNPDGAFTAILPDGATLGGVYEVVGDQLCITPAGADRGCTAYVGDKNVGDTWTQTSTDGIQITVSLQAGR